MARKKRHIQHEEDNHMGEDWLLPYADLVTLLLALFIVLFSMRSEDQAKMDAMMEALYKAFNTVSVFDTNSGGQSLTSNVTLPNQQQNSNTEPKTVADSEISEEELKLQDLMKELQAYIDQKQLNAEISLTDLKVGIQITLKERIIFDSGSDRIKSNFFPILDDIGGMLQTLDNPIIIEGHTDNKPIKSSKFPSNWELSGARALTVVHYLQTKNIEPNRLSFTGYGEFKPVISNDTEENREANRRVNIVILR